MHPARHCQDAIQVHPDVALARHIIAGGIEKHKWRVVIYNFNKNKQLVVYIKHDDDKRSFTQHFSIKAKRAGSGQH
jgi:hypothetical protein